MSVLHAWSGGVTQSKARVIVKTSGSGATRLVVSKSSDLLNALLFGPITPTLNIAKFELSGLSANTQYYYGVQVDGVMEAFLGKFRTTTYKGFPKALERIIAYSCSRGTVAPGSASGVSNSSLYLNMRHLSADMIIQMGDLHYRDITTNNPALFRSAYDDVLGQTNALEFFKSLATAYVWDDHDYAGNDADKNGVSRPAACQVYRERVPSYDLPASSGAVYQAFVRGRLRYVLTDVRSERNPISNTDNASKKVLSDEQFAWFQAQLIAARDAGQVVCWVNTYPWIAATTAGADHWGGFNTARTTIANLITSLGMAGRIFIISGDMHALAIDDGRNNAWGGFPVFHFAALDSSTSTKGGPYWKGPSAGANRYGVLDITDDGDTISVTGSGYINGALWDSYTKTFSLPAKIRSLQGGRRPMHPLKIGSEGWESQ